MNDEYITIMIYYDFIGTLPSAFHDLLGSAPESSLQISPSMPKTSQKTSSACINEASLRRIL